METIIQNNVEITLGNKFPIKGWTVGIEVEDHAKAQLNNVANLPFIFKHVAVMPDVHTGFGATIGSVIPTIGAISPSSIGVDISCGMMAIKTTLTRDDFPKDLAAIRSLLEAAVPHGLTKGRDSGSWGEIPNDIKIAWMELEPGYRELVEKHPQISHRGPENQIGTLGSGNHFLSINSDTYNNVWIMLHSGSRGPGNKIGTYFTRLAKKLNEQWFITMSDPELSYLPEGTKEFSDYMDSVNWCQRYAKVNREQMMQQAIRALQKSKLVPKFEIEQEIDCNHNYVARENHFGQNILVTRKGAINASVGRLGVIPGTMAGKSFIVIGKGNPESFNSASHGAGRKMSRTKAKETFTLKDHRAATEGVECRLDSGVLDETPGSYKNIDEVLKAELDLVEPIETLKEFISVKG